MFGEIGMVEAFFRFPGKSMRGEQIEIATQNVHARITEIFLHESEIGGPILVSEKRPLAGQLLAE